MTEHCLNRCGGQQKNLGKPSPDDMEAVPLPPNKAGDVEVGPAVPCLLRMQHVVSCLAELCYLSTAPQPHEPQHTCGLTGWQGLRYRVLKTDDCVHRLSAC